DKAKLQIVTAVKGSDASSMSAIGVTAADITTANGSGILSVSLLDITLAAPMAKGTDKEMFVITFTIAADASGDVPVTLTDVALSDPLASTITVTVVDGKVTAGSAAPPPAANTLKVTDATGAAGADVAVKVLATVDKDVGGAGFKVNFDKAKLQIVTAVKGSDASSMSAIGVAAADIATANDNGVLAVSLLDITLAAPMAAGTDKEMFVITFTIAADASGDVPVTLTDVSLSDPLASTIVVTVSDGKVTVEGGVTPPPTEDPPTDKNIIYCLPVVGSSGASAVASVGMNNLVAIAAIEFKLGFDHTLIQLSAVKTGVKATGLSLIGAAAADIATANTTGELKLQLLDITLSSPIATGLGNILDIDCSFSSDGTATFTLADIVGSDAAASSVSFDEWTPGAPTPIGIEGIAGAALPQSFSLNQNSPNPFNPSTSIAFEVSDQGAAVGRVSLKVFNLRGQLVRTLVDGVKSSGHYSVQWDGRSDNGAQVASGVYFYRLKTDDFVQTRKMVLLK
ncbi:MAG: cohesin domain-containing protein, partial [Gemmatimonadota bacterium]|nr:cohesin domain-containing protein [Gemmatimonadota bacterium]